MQSNVHTPKPPSTPGIRIGIWLLLGGVIVSVALGAVALSRRDSRSPAAIEVGAMTLKTGGTEIVLPTGWEPLEQPKNFFVQERAVQRERAIALSAGTFRLDLPLEQYVALSLM